MQLCYSLPADNAGAGMIGTVEFNSATLYRYATLTTHDLCKELASETEVTAKVVAEFARAFITSMPEGKQNTFANRTLPTAVMVALRADQPLNLVDAFEEPIRGESLAKKSVKQFVRHAQQVYQDFSSEPICAWVIGEGMDDLGARETLNGLLEALRGEVIARFSVVGE